MLTLFFSASNVIVVTFNGLKDNFRETLYFLGSALSFFLISAGLFLFGVTDAVNSFWYGRLISWIIFTIIPLLDMLVRGLFKVSIKIPNRIIIFALNTFAASLAYVLFTQWDSIIVTQLGSSEENRIYKSIVFIVSLPLALRLILETKLLPDFSSHFIKENKEQLRSEFISFTSLLIGLGVICTGLGVILAEPILSIFYNPEIGLKSGFIFPVTLLGTFLYIASVPGISALQAIGKESIVRNDAIVQSIMFFCFSVLLFKQYGINILPVLLLLVNVIFNIFIVFKANKLLK